ncbi:hypothetical protein Igni_1302 [Ignicoccus hospitalis KIN4/I]|uniref:Uncharacterized protein n=1 Tax=Ignicoccus hospitalis (strain KIN4/I / DSM 18386 / JCM 14125) TaxID=453591 RepID=A8AC26_IGNH4|nr:hypothetical protein [Ignicoccus hospitalis]ABU82478.1 hypothetical protein Igni_1302 [Ignicoccus hospitalis KIN4/I]HIH90573.1 hypothetical protein [Desulfurococcaceae archaeon]
MPKTVSDKDLEKLLEEITDTETEDIMKKNDPKYKWIRQIMISAKKYHKLCPYYDKRTGKCFLEFDYKCDRAGKFDGCPVFIRYLEKKYDELKAKGKRLPMDFMDLSLV